MIDSALIDDPRRLPTGRDALVLGELLLAAGEPNAAISAIREAIDRDRGDYFYKSLGVALFAQGKSDEAKVAFRRAITPQWREDGMFDQRTAPLVDNWQSVASRQNAGPDQITAAYFLDLVTQDQYTDHFRKDKRFACFPWFFVGQRREIDGNREEAVNAYKRCVELGDDETAHSFRSLAQWRLSKLSPKS